MRDMDAVSFGELLRTEDACFPAKQWAEGKTLAEVWSTCDRGDWMLWLVGTMADRAGWPTRQQIVLAACDCAEPALKYLPEGDRIPRNAIEVARRWARGEASLDEVIAAVEAVIKDSYWYVTTAYSAAIAALNAAKAAYDSSTVYTCASETAFAGKGDPISADSLEERRARVDYSLRLSADICRKYFAVETVTEPALVA